MIRGKAGVNPEASSNDDHEPDRFVNIVKIKKAGGTFSFPYIQEIPHYRQTEERLKIETEKLNILAETARLLMSSEKPERVVQIIGERVMQFLHCHFFFNYFIDESGQYMHLNAYAGISAHEAEKISPMKVGDSVCGKVALEGKRIIETNISQTNKEITRIIRSFGASAYVCHPLLSQGCILGTFSFGTRDKTSFTNEELDLMQAVTDLVAMAMARKKTEDSLRGTSQYLENLTRYANAPIIVWDNQYRILRFNKAFEFLTGLAADDVIGKPLGTLFPEKSKESSMELIRKTSYGERWESVEMPVKHISGTTKVVLWNSANVYDVDGETIISTLAQGQDITARKYAEETAEKNASLLQAALDSTADGILVVDNERKITSYNKKFCTIWGIPENKLNEAQEATALLYISPLVADIQEFSVRMNELYNHRGRESYDMVRLIDGRVFERYSKPQKIGETIVGRVWSYRDITERRHAEESLQESLEKFRIIATSTPDHIVVQDKDLRYTLVINPQLDTTEKDMIGKTDYDLISKEEADTVTAIKKRVLENGTTATSEFAITGVKGEKNYFIGSYVPKKNASGEIDGIIGYFRDVTETKLANEKILAALGEKEILIREIHHRVKNNLQIITGLLEMTRSRTNDPITTGILTDMMLKIKTMAQIHTRLYQSNQSGQINMGAQIQDMMIDLAGIYGKSGPVINSDVDTEGFTLPVDLAIPCALAINEILSNAFIYAFKGRKEGTVHVSAWREEDLIHIIIKDDGIGIPPEVDPNTTSSLGLKLIRNLVRQLRGTLSIESNDKGTLIRIDFPIETSG
ncbi:MAG: PAS domain S-box protein [Methanoregula sp.]|uniref:PAS domain S-box protein n=1 Tax=Methanoregula sp. TaxID=2052170 RepID=UPI003BB20458